MKGILKLSSKPSICFIGTQFKGVPSEQAGAIEYLSFELAKSLAERGFEITYYSTKSKSVFNQKNLNIKRFPAKKINGSLFNAFVLLNALNKKFDAIYLSGCSMLPSALMLKNLKSIPLIYHEFNHLPWMKSKSQLFDFLAKQSVKASDLTIIPSKFIQKKINSQLQNSSIVIIPNFINLQEFPKKFPAKKKQLLFAGRIEKHKGIHHLINSFSLIAEKSKKWSLVIAGPKTNNPYFNELQKLIEEKNLQKRVEFKLSLGRKELLKEFSASPIFVFPSSEEAFGLVLIEAMASFAVPIVFDCCASNEIIENGKNGLLSEKGNEKELAEKMRGLIENGKMRKKIALNARKKSEKYVIESISKEFEKQLLKVIK